MNKLIGLLGVFFLSCAVTADVWALGDTVQTPEAMVHLVVEKPLSPAGASARIGFFFDLKPHWHVYWKNPGDSGLAPKVEWLDGKENLEFSEFFWPVPKRISLTILANYGYEGEVLFPLTVKKIGTGSVAKKLSVKLSWLVCKEECVPRDGIFEIDLTKKTNLHANLNQTFPKVLAGWQTKKVTASDTELRLDLEIPFSASKLNEKNIDFFPSLPGLTKAFHRPSVKVEKAGEASSKLTFVFSSRGTEESKRIKQIDGLLFLGDGETYDISSTPSDSSIPDAPGDLSPTESGPSFALLVLFAFLGGILLNFMPCVFPILAIKIFDFSHRKTDSQRELRVQSYFYVLGVLLSFWALVSVIFILRSQGKLLGWGFQLQSATFIVFLSALFALLALNFWGLFEIHVPFLSKAVSMKVQEGRIGALMSGFLTTIVSTPCTAPFLGAALGAALAISMFKSLVIFTFMALGVALPYFLLVHTPSLREKLPKPGLWMEQLKHFLGFFMMATVIWLLSVLGKQNQLASVIWALAGLLLLSIGVWWKGFAKPFFRVLFYASAIAALLLARAPQQVNSTWEPFDAAKAAVLAKDRIVFIDFTASWCLTCQVNKAVAIETKKVKDGFEKYRVVLMRADWTNQDEAITKELAKYGRSSVPTNVILGPGNKAPLVLPTLLTSSAIMDAIGSRNNE